MDENVRILKILLKKYMFLNNNGEIDHFEYSVSTRVQKLNSTLVYTSLGRYEKYE